MLSVEEIAIQTPPRRLTITTGFERLWISSLQARVYERLYGFHEVPIAEPGEEFVMLETAVARVIDSANIDPLQVQLIVHAHTGPYIGPVGHSLPRRLVRRFGPHICCFGMQLHKCVSSISALRLIERLLRRYPLDARAILLVGEVSDSKELRSLDAGIVGDVGCAALLSRCGQHDRLIAEYVRIHGEFAKGVFLAADAPERVTYDARFQDNLAEVVHGSLNKAGISLDQVRYFLPHNVNINSWIRTIQHLELDRERVFLNNIPRYGHCCGADWLINLADVRQVLQSGDYYLMVTVGVGGMFGAALMQH